MNGRVRLFWLVLTALFAALAILACVYSHLFGSVWHEQKGDPAETVTRFFDSIRIGNYPSAYSCLSDYMTLGLETEPETPEAKQICAALKQSYRYTLNGECSVKDQEAVQGVSFRALNIRKTEEAVAKLAKDILAQKTTELPAAEVYDENGALRESVTDAVYREALDEALKNPDFLCADTELDIRLIYTGGGWLIVTDKALMNALVGGES